MNEWMNSLIIKGIKYPKKYWLFYGASFLWKYQDNSLPYYIFSIINHPVYQLTPKYFLMIPEHCVDLSSQAETNLEWNISSTKCLLCELGQIAFQAVKQFKPSVASFVSSLQIKAISLD